MLPSPGRVHLRQIKVWDIISGITARSSFTAYSVPIAPSESEAADVGTQPTNGPATLQLATKQIAWDELSNNAATFINDHLDTYRVLLIPAYETISGIWMALSDHFDKRTPPRFTISGNAYLDQLTTMKQHLVPYASLWSQLLERAATAKYSIVCTNIVDNLQTKRNLTYEDVRQEAIWGASRRMTMDFSIFMISPLVQKSSPRRRLLRRSYGDW